MIEIIDTALSLALIAWMGGSTIMIGWGIVA